VTDEEESFRDYSGYILYLPNRVGRLTRVSRETLENPPALKYVRPLEEQWESYRFTSREPLLHDEGEANSEGYVYQIAVLRGSRVVVLARNLIIVKALLRNLLATAIRPNLRFVRIDVHRFVQNMVRPKPPFKLTYVRAKTPAFVDQMRTISYSGQSLADAALFRTQMEDDVRCEACGIRREREKTQLARFGADGYVSISGLDRLGAVNEALRFLSKEGYLQEEEEALRAP